MGTLNDGAIRETAILVVVTTSVATAILYLRLVCSVPRWPRQTTFRERTVLWMGNSTMGHTLNFMHAFFSLISCILFVVETYLVIDEEEDDPDSAALRRRWHAYLILCEIGFQPSFTFQYFLLLYTHATTFRSAIAYVLSVPALIDVITILPVYIELVVKMLSDSGGNVQLATVTIGFVRVARAFKVARVLRVLRYFRSHVMARGERDGSGSSSSREVEQQMVMLVGTVLLLIVMSTGVVQWLSTNEGFTIVGVQRPLQFHEAFYFTVVTLSTVGYGEIVPVSLMARLVMMVIILLFMYLVPYQTANFLTYNSMLSKYRGAFRHSGRKHIVVCCSPGCEGARRAPDPREGGSPDPTPLPASSLPPAPTVAPVPPPHRGASARPPLNSEEQESGLSRSAGRARAALIPRRVALLPTPRPLPSHWTGVDRFLHDFFHKDHGMANMQVVLLVPAEPTAQFKEIIVSYARDQRVQYLKGDLLSSQARAGASIRVGVQGRGGNGRPPGTSLPAPSSSPADVPSRRT